MDCVFCAIATGEIPATIIHADASAVAFLDRSPKAPGHTLVIPRRHVENLTSSGDALTEIAPAVSHVAALLQSRLGASGINAVVNSGAAAGQEVMHLHVHVVPTGVDGSVATDGDTVRARLVD